MFKLRHRKALKYVEFAAQFKRELGLIEMPTYRDSVSVVMAVCVCVCLAAGNENGVVFRESKLAKIHIPKMGSI